MENYWINDVCANKYVQILPLYASINEKRFPSNGAEVTCV